MAKSDDELLLNNPVGSVSFGRLNDMALAKLREFYCSNVGTATVGSLTKQGEAQRKNIIYAKYYADQLKLIDAELQHRAAKGTP